MRRTKGGRFQGLCTVIDVEAETIQLCLPGRSLHKSQSFEAPKSEAPKAYHGVLRQIKEKVSELMA